MGNAVKGTLLVAMVLMALAVCGQAFAQQRPSYPWEMPLEDIEKATGFKYECGPIQVTFPNAVMGPIIIKLPGEEGGAPVPTVTGLELLGVGHITVKMGEEVLMDDDVHGAMFRFHPDNYEQFVSMAERAEAPDAGMRALLLHMCSGSFRRFWHSGMNAFVPDEGAGAVWVYSKTHGGTMVWKTQKELVGYCMDTQKELFKR